MAKGQEAQTAKASEAVVLSPFTVNAESSKGYGTANAFTATRIGIAISDTPLSVQVVTREFLDDLNIKNFQDSLRYTSGVSADSLGLGRQPTASTFQTVRGFVPTLILGNGFRRPNSMQSVDDAARIEVVKGPASVFFGQAAPGGIINILSLRPEQKQSATIEHTYGSYSFNKTKLNLTGPTNIKNLNYRLVGVYENSKDWKDFTYSDRKAFIPSVSWHNDRVSVWVRYEHTDSTGNSLQYSIFGNRTFFADYAKPPADILAATGLTVTQAQSRWRGSIQNWTNDVALARGETQRPYRVTEYIQDLSPRGTRFNVGGPDQYETLQLNDLIAEATFKVSNHLNLRYGVDYSRQRYEALRSGFAIPNGDRTVNLLPIFENNRYSWEVHQFDALWDFDTKLVKSKFVASGQYTQSRNRAPTVTLNTAAAPGGAAAYQFYSPLSGEPPRLGLVPRGTPTYVSTGNSRNYTRAVAASWFGSWFNDRLTTLVGARRETDIRQRLGLPAIVDLNRSATIPMGGFTFKITNGINAFASYSKNYSPNGVRSATGPGLLPSDNATDLPVELGKGFDVGVKAVSTSGKLSGTLSFYQIDRLNLPKTNSAREVADPRNALGLASATSVRFNTPGGSERSQGAEVDLLYSPFAGYQLILAGSWMWQAETIKDPSVLPGTFQYERLFKQGRRLINAPEKMLSMWNKYEFKKYSKLEGLSMGFGFRYSSETEPRASDLTTLLKNPSFMVCDAMISYTIKAKGRDMDLSINGENLANKEYYQGATGVSDPRKIFMRASFKF